MHSYTWTHQCWPISKKLHSSLCGHWMQFEGTYKERWFVCWKRDKGTHAVSTLWWWFYGRPTFFFNYIWFLCFNDISTFMDYLMPKLRSCSPALKPLRHGDSFFTLRISWILKRSKKNVSDQICFKTAINTPPKKTTTTTKNNRSVTITLHEVSELSFLTEADRQWSEWGPGQKELNNCPSDPSHPTINSWNIWTILTWHLFIKHHTPTNIEKSIGVFISVLTE